MYTRWSIHQDENLKHLYYPSQSKHTFSRFSRTFSPRPYVIHTYIATRALIASPSLGNTSALEKSHFDRVISASPPLASRVLRASKFRPPRPPQLNCPSFRSAAGRVSRGEEFTRAPWVAATLSWDVYIPPPPLSFFPLIELLSLETFFFISW